MHCTTTINSSNTEMSVLERQQLLQQHPVPYMNKGNDHFLGGFLFENNDHGQQLLMGGALKSDPGMVNGWAGDELGRLLNYGNGLELESGCVIPRTTSCPPDVAAAIAEVETYKRKENVKKRKADKGQNSKAAEEENNQEKKKKECVEEEGSKITEELSNSKSTITNASKKKQHSGDKSNVSDAPKQDYIHVRARRGQATDSHSLAERVRREKISERMKYLQDLVPGCNKITGKAGMLDEIINYVQSLQKQVEFLSMKLSVVTPQIDCEASNNMFKQQLFPACTSSMVDPGQLQFDALTQGVSVSGLDTGAISSEAALRRTISAPVHIPDTILDSSCYNALNWDVEVQNMFHGMEYQQGRLASFVSQPFTGYMETGHVKMEM